MQYTGDRWAIANLKDGLECVYLSVFSLCSFTDPTDGWASGYVFNAE